MSVKDDLGVRMKTYYEQIPKMKLMRRCPVLIRIDGKAFHTFTRGFKKPFDEILIRTMQETTQYLCGNIQGCVLGYTQSDEITLVLVDYKKLTSSAWFDYEVQKMCSIAASMATMAFGKFFISNVKEFGYNNGEQFDMSSNEGQQKSQLLQIYRIAIDKGAMFDARCFSIPKEEVTNCLYWRQLDASRNSIQMVGQANFSHKELQNKSCNEIQDMLMIQKGINWNDLPTYQKRGSCVVKEKYFDSSVNGSVESYINPWRTRWIIDENIPMFKGEGRDYIDKLIYVGEK
jgi:tRNA(His) guanylyltransferase